MVFSTSLHLTEHRKVGTPPRYRMCLQDEPVGQTMCYLLFPLNVL